MSNNSNKNSIYDTYKPPLNNTIGKVEIHQQSLNIVKSRFISHVIQKYYIINAIFLLIYPILRISGLILKPNNELMILYVSFFMVILKILKNKNLDQILTGIIFSMKMSTIILLYYSGEHKFKLEYKLANQVINSEGEKEEIFKFGDENENNDIDIHTTKSSNISTSNLGYAANIFHYGFYYVLLYLVLCIILYLYKSQPEPKQSNNVQFFNQLTLKNSLLNSKQSKELKDKYLLVEFFTTWSPPCTYLASTFADLSYIYNGINFGKIDIGRWKNIAFEYDINDSISSKQIPSLILFKNGIEVMRLPYRKSEFQLAYDKKLTRDEKLFVPCNFTFDDIKNYFNLEKLQNEVKQSTNYDNNSNNKTNKNSKKNK